MDDPSSDIPFASDPALCDDWYLGHETTPVPPSNTHSDDLEALHLLDAETKARKTEEGIVVQHRAWKVEEVFRSDLDHPQETPLRPRTANDLVLTTITSPTTSATMPCSSPPAYPMDSPPPTAKRPATKPTGAFLDIDSDEEDAFNLEDEPVAKRRMLSPFKDMPDTILRSIPIPNTTLQTTVVTQGSKPKSTGAFVMDADSDDDMDALGSNLQGQIQKEAEILAKKATTHATNPAPYTTALPSYLSRDFGKKKEGKTCSGKTIGIPLRQKTATASYEEMISARSKVRAGKAQTSYYGIDILQLKENAHKTIKAEAVEKAKAAKALPSADPEAPLPTTEVVGGRTRRTHMWTEKYRARRFFDLCGDDRTHRDVLRWLKGWDPIVFPASAKAKAKPAHKRPDVEGEEEEKRHKKILLLTGPPGLGKTTLAHVCAQQAGYEIMEINASDDRSANVVKGRIRTSVGTESVKTVTGGGPAKAGEKSRPVRPVCVVVDEVDGVVSGGGPSGEGGFIKALIDLVELDAKNSGPSAGAKNRKKKEDETFRLLRPLVLICNDVYHPSLRPLRQSGHAEIIHIRKPPLDAVVKRMKTVFEKEGILCEADGIRKLCESTWGMQSGTSSSNSKPAGASEGDLRSVLVVGEWIARKLQSEHRGPSTQQPKLTKKWMEKHLAGAVEGADGGTRGVARGGSKEVVSRVFITGAGFPIPAAAPTPQHKSSTHTGDARLAPVTKLHAAEVAKRHGMNRLREMVDTSDEHDRIVSDIFATFPTHQFNDDTVLSKPDKAYEWLHFYNQCSQGVYVEQSWELIPYLSQPILACHDLFAAPARSYGAAKAEKWEKKTEGEKEEVELPYTGLKADYEAKEATKRNRDMLEQMLNSLKDENHIHREQDAGLLRSFRGPENMATELLPWLLRIISPDVKPVVVGGSGENRGVASVRREGEREMVRRAVDVMAALGVSYQRGKLEAEFGVQTQWVYRMDPPLDEFNDFPTAPSSTAFSAAPIRYAVRQVLDQEYQKALMKIAHGVRQARFKEGNALGEESVFTFKNKGTVDSLMKRVDGDEEQVVKVKRDFFGRVVVERSTQDLPTQKRRIREAKKDTNKVWVTYHEGFSNAVRKPVTVEDVMRAFL